MKFRKSYHKPVSPGDILIVKEKNVRAFHGYEESLNRVHLLPVCAFNINDILLVLSRTFPRYEGDNYNHYAFTLCFHPQLGLVTLDCITDDNKEYYNEYGGELSLELVTTREYK